jgi:predicted TIM-barrel fold metal-dependent hydrolase
MAAMTTPTIGVDLDVVDCDVHPNVERGLHSVYPYMTEAWRQRFLRKRSHQLGTQITVKFNHPNGTIQRDDARPPSGRPAASDPAFMVDDLLDRYRIGTAILNSLQATSLCAVLAGADESVVLASAFNDYFVDTWLTREPRFRLAITVPPQDVAAAVAEIERLGDRTDVAAVALPMIDALLGDRRWWPIYEAARLRGLPILVHGSGTEGVVQGAPRLAGGIADSYIERYLGMTQLAEAQIANLVFSGTLERFRDLKFVFVEFGFIWLVPLLWRMDRAWRQLRYEVPWVKRSPIDYVHAQCRFTTQPMDEPSNPRELETMIGLVGTDHLCFASDYPHWDNEMPGQVLRSLPPAVQRRVFRDNARETFRIS